MLSACPSFALVRPSVRSFLRSSGQMVFHERLEQSRWNYRQYSVGPTDDLVRFWRSKAKVTAGRRGGEGIHVDDRASMSMLYSYSCKYSLLTNSIHVIMQIKIKFVTSCTAVFTHFIVAIKFNSTDTDTVVLLAYVHKKSRSDSTPILWWNTWLK